MCNEVNKVDNEWVCNITNKECMFDEPNKEKCKEMYEIPNEDKKVFESIEEINRNRMIEELTDESGDFQDEDDELDNLVE